jgi:hypothetical protein
VVRHYSHPARFSMREIAKAEGINYKTLWAMLHGNYVTQEEWDQNQGRVRKERADLLAERVAMEKDADLEALQQRNNEARRNSGSLRVRHEQQSMFYTGEDSRTETNAL